MTGNPHSQYGCRSVKPVKWGKNWSEDYTVKHSTVNRDSCRCKSCQTSKQGDATVVSIRIREDKKPKGADGLAPPWTTNIE